MRVWLVNPKDLSDQHLLGQHQELHMLVAMIKNERFYNHCMTRFYSSKQGFIFWLHERLVDELDYRFNHLEKNYWSHPSPLTQSWASKQIWRPNAAWIKFDRTDLALRYKRAPKGKFTWTKRKRPEWTYGKGIRKDLVIGPIPAHTAGAKLVARLDYGPGIRIYLRPQKQGRQYV